MLEVRNVNGFYGDVQALADVSLTANEGEIVAIVGANGAGKTTLLSVISGLLPKATGEVLFRGQQTLGRKPHEIVELGLAQVMEGRQIFPFMTVLENLRDGLLLAARAGALRAAPGRGLRAVPRSQAAAVTACRLAVRRRAADARDRPRADEPAVR